MPSKRPPLDKALLERMYIRQRRSMADIARMLRVSPSRVKDSLEFHDIELDHEDRAKASTTFLPPEQIKKLYVEQKVPITRIAQRYGVAHQRISDLLRGLDVQIRPRTSKYLVRAVTEIKIVTVDRTLTGQPITRPTAILECGHRHPLTRNQVPKDITTLRFGCRACGLKEGNNDG